MLVVGIDQKIGRRRRVVSTTSWRSTLMTLRRNEDVDWKTVEADVT